MGHSPATQAPDIKNANINTAKYLISPGVALHFAISSKQGSLSISDGRLRHCRGGVRACPACRHGTSELA